MTTNNTNRPFTITTRNTLDNEMTSETIYFTDMAHALANFKPGQVLENGVGFAHVVVSVWPADPTPGTNEAFSALHSVNLGLHVAHACETFPNNVDAAWFLSHLLDGALGLASLLAVVKAHRA